MQKQFEFEKKCSRIKYLNLNIALDKSQKESRKWVDDWVGGIGEQEIGAVMGEFCPVP